jgi:hypothetical protein
VQSGAGGGEASLSLGSMRVSLGSQPVSSTANEIEQSEVAKHLELLAYLWPDVLVQRVCLL